MQNPEYNIMRLIELEQTIISGVNDKSTALNEGAMSKELTKTIKKIGRPIDIVRLLAIYLNCYAVPKADFKSILSLVNSDEEREILEQMNLLSNSDKVKKITRTRP